MPTYTRAAINKTDKMFVYFPRDRRNAKVRFISFPWPYPISSNTLLAATAAVAVVGARFINGIASHFSHNNLPILVINVVLGNNSILICTGFVMKYYVCADTTRNKNARAKLLKNRKK